ncbi:membrane protein insertase YidC [Nocardioides sp.]|uniref:membrane protein insertase YidC n=1 Tax=Nocardioides sp. TaxID=35761 RepID=UPI0039C8E211
MSSLILGPLGTIGHYILTPLYYAISGLLLAWHWLFSRIGMDPAGGAAWGLSIIGLTLVVRAALIPLFVKQIKASRNMQLIQPKVKELQKKYGHDRERLAQETMKLYKDSGTNPFASCLPIILQMPIFLALFRLIDQAAKHGTAHGFMTEAQAQQFGDAKLFGKIPLAASFTDSQGIVAVQVIAAILVLAMTATTFTTQRQLMAKNMPADALTGPYAQQQKLLLYVLPVVFAVGGIAFPIGVLLYWTTSNLWTMGQQFYVIRNNPAPGTEAARLKAERDAKKAAAHGDEGGSVAGDETAGTTQPTDAPPESDRRPAQRQQPKRQSKSQRQSKPAGGQGKAGGGAGKSAGGQNKPAGGSGKSGARSPSGNQRSQNDRRNGKQQ